MPGCKRKSLLVVMQGVENTDYGMDDPSFGKNVRDRATVGSLEEAAQALDSFVHRHGLSGPSVMPARIYERESLEEIAHASWNGREARVRMGRPGSGSAIVTGPRLSRCR